jgi:hypothetical protein
LGGLHTYATGWTEGALLFVSVDSERIPSGRYRVAEVVDPTTLKLVNPFDLDDKEQYSPFVNEANDKVSFELS